MCRTFTFTFTWQEVRCKIKLLDCIPTPLPCEVAFILIPRLGSRRSSLISIEHAELLRSTPSLVLCCAWLVTMALHVHGGLGQLSPLPTSGDDKWVAAKHCGRAKRSRIIDTHRLRSSLQFRYINNQSLLLLYFIMIFTCAHIYNVKISPVGWISSHICFGREQAHLNVHNYLFIQLKIRIAPSSACIQD